MKKIGLFLFVLLALLACRKDSEEIAIIETHYTPPVVRVNGTVAGIVTDEQGTAVAGAVVRLGSQQRVSGSGGHFLFSEVSLNANGTLISTDHAGHFRASARFFPQANAVSYVRLRLLAKPEAGRISADAGGLLAMPSGARLSLPPKSVAASDGTLYQGEVVAAARWLSPGSPESGLLMPGGQQGVDQYRREVALASYGMMAIELRSPTGEPLNLAAGAEAELFFPMPPAMLGAAPAQMPLWHLDESTGLWHEEGLAYQAGNGYIGKVSHFSFWHLETPHPLVNLRGRLRTPTGAPLPNIGLRLALSDGASAGSAFSDHEGVFLIPAPADEALLLQVFSPCGTLALELPIGPFSAGANLGDISVPGEVLRAAAFTGRLIDCDAQPVSNGIVQVCSGGTCLFLAAATDGQFEGLIAYCADNQLELTAFDLLAGLSSAPIVLGIAEENDLGDWAVCDAPLPAFIRIEFLGQQRTFLPPLNYQSDGWTYIRATDSPYDIFIAIEGLQQAGAYQDSQVRFKYLEYTTVDGVLNLWSASCQWGQNTCVDLTVNITEYGAVGSYIRGDFSVKADLAAGVAGLFPGEPINGEFAVIRQQ